MNYTSNILEPIRIKMGKVLISHEIFKLMQDLDYEKIKEQINCKWDNFDDNVTVRDFWNLVDSLMMGYKLKNVVCLITSSQIIWNLANTKIDDLRFTSDITSINGFDIKRKTAKDVSIYLNDNSDVNVFDEVKRKMQQEFTLAGARLSDPVMVEQHIDDTLHVHDGNLRLLKAIIEKKEAINAYIGKHNNETQKSNHWIPTSYLQRLSDQQQRDLLIKLLQESENAIYEFKNRVCAEEKFSQEVLKALNTS